MYLMEIKVKRTKSNAHRPCAANTKKEKPFKMVRKRQNVTCWCEEVSSFKKKKRNALFRSGDDDEDEE